MLADIWGKLSISQLPEFSDALLIQFERSLMDG